MADVTPLVFIPIPFGQNLSKPESFWHGFDA